jgi:uncharacterized membrane protein
MTGKTQTGLDENLAAAIAYALGLFGGILFLVLEKENRFVRFHAMQSLITFTAAAITCLMLVSLPFVGWLLAPIFILCIIVLWVVLMYKAVNGQRYKLPYIGDWAEQQVK